MHLYGIIGAGGMGRETLPLVRPLLETWHGLDCSELVFVVEDRYPIAQKVINGHRVLSMSQFLSEPAQRYFNIAIADSKVRERISKSILREQALPFQVTASTSVEQDESQIEEGALICHFTFIGPNAKIGRFFHLNHHSYVSHDCIIGDFVTFAPNVMCNGYVHIEDHAYIGAGAVIKDGTNKPITIGKDAVIGMGAVVTKSVPAGATVVGNPALIKPSLNRR